MRIRRYTASSHVQNRIVDRNIKKIDVVEHVYRRPIEVTKVKYNEKNQPSYDIIGSKVTTSVNPNNKVITTIHPTHSARKKSLKEKRK